MWPKKKLISYSRFVKFAPKRLLCSMSRRSWCTLKCIYNRVGDSFRFLPSILLILLSSIPEVLLTGTEEPPIVVSTSATLSEPPACLDSIEAGRMPQAFMLTLGGLEPGAFLYALGNPVAAARSATPFNGEFV